MESRYLSRLCLALLTQRPDLNNLFSAQRRRPTNRVILTENVAHFNTWLLFLTQESCQNETFPLKILLKQDFFLYTEKLR